MPKEQPIEIFMPPNMLKAKVGGRVGGIDMAAVRRAEQALASLKDEFGDWIAADVAALAEACDGFKADTGAERRDALFRAGHDLRGQALTFGFPLVARVAASLCKLLDGHGNAVPQPLIEAHVNAIRVIVRQNIKDDADKTACTLAAELDVRVTQYLEKLG